MPIAVLSDIHGNYPALQAMLADARQAGVQHYLVAGDLLDRSPYPYEVMDCLRSLGAQCVRGNSDQYLIDYARNPLPGPTRAVIAWAYQKVGLPGADWLDSLPIDTVVTLPGFPPIHIAHARPGSFSGALLPTGAAALDIFRRAGLYQKTEPPAPLVEQLRGSNLHESLFICGHTHIPWAEQVNGHNPTRLEAPGLSDQRELQDQPDLPNSQVLAAHEGRPVPHGPTSLAGSLPPVQQVLNPGGGGLPVNCDPRAQYALLDWRRGAWQIEHRAIEYDRESLRQAFYQRGLLPEGGSFARACLGNLLTGQNASMFFIHRYKQLEQELGDSQAGWDEATRRFEWVKYGL